MYFGQDRNNDDYLHLKDNLYALRKALGDKISQAAIEDGII